MSDTTRRTVIKTAAWTTPVIAAMGAAPAFATSLRKDPGINGWVLNSPEDRDNRRWYLRVNSNPSNPGSTPDGAPFGLYVYDVNVIGNQIQDTLTNARIVYWIIGEQSESSWSENSGHGNGWSNPVRGASEIKSDGLRYTPYTFTYTGSFTLRPDGRVWLEEFDTTAAFRQERQFAYDVTYWTQRFITVNNVVKTFERRNGTRGEAGSNNFAGRQVAASSDKWT